MKIAKLISKCNDCSFCNFVQEIGGNTLFAALCIPVDDDETFNLKKNQAPFLLTTSTSNIKDNNIEIPNKCPLEGYKIKKNETN